MLPEKIIMRSLFIALIMSVFVISCEGRAQRIKPDSDVIGQEVICPVMGGRLKITKYTPVVEYKDKKYYFCCAGCDKDFLKDPEKYIKQMHAYKSKVVELEKEEIGKDAVCPVSGEKFAVNESTIVVEYNGERYFMCCPGCDKGFMKAPEEYLQKVKEGGQSGESDQTGKKIEYWTCSMHPEVKSDKEGNCPICGMGLIPVYKKTGSETFLNMSDKAIELAGIRMVPARKTEIYKEIQIVGKVAYDPELVIAQEEFLNALEMESALEESDDITMERAKKVVEKSKYKLRLLGMDESGIQRLKKRRKAETSLIIPEQETWIYADVYESDIGWIKKNQNVVVTSIAYPDEEFPGKIKSINPILNSKTRSVQVRICLSNRNMILKPGMYVDVKIKAKYKPPAGKNVVAVPKTSVLDTGNRKIVWVYLGDGNFEPREVNIGAAGIVADGEHRIHCYPVLSGLKESEIVVTNGNFLIDSESQLTGVAALGYGGAVGIEEKLPAPVHQH